MPVGPKLPPWHYAPPSRLELPPPTPYALEEARGRVLALRATAMGALEAVETAAFGDEALATALYLETFRSILRLVPIPAGTFLMGYPKEEISHSSSDKPQRLVTIKRPFLMGAVPVTQAVWREVMGDNPSEGDSAYRGEYPVDSVSWEEVMCAWGFMDKVNLLTEGARPKGTTFRLPSEAEWDYAWRGGVPEPEPSTEGARLGGMPEDHQSAPVGQLPPNAFGLYDMAGDILEWCQDLWHECYSGARTDARPWLAGGEKGLRVVRGKGCDPVYDRRQPANRNGFDQTRPYANVGFRVVCG